MICLFISQRLHVHFNSEDAPSVLCFLVPAALTISDIRNLAKLRKLKQYAVNADVSGLVKVSNGGAMKDRAEQAYRGVDRVCWYFTAQETLSKLF